MFFKAFILSIPVGVILDAKISARIRYGYLAHVNDGCRQKHCIQNCGQKVADKDIITLNSL